MLSHHVLGQSHLFGAKLLFPSQIKEGEKVQLKARDEELTVWRIAKCSHLIAAIYEALQMEKFEIPGSMRPVYSCGRGLWTNHKLLFQ